MPSHAEASQWRRWLAVAIVGVMTVGGAAALYAWQRFEDIPTVEYEAGEVERTLKGLSDPERFELIQEMTSEELEILIAQYGLPAGGESDLAALEQAMAERPPPFEVPEAVSPPLPDAMFNSYLLIGSDASGYLADTIILVLFPTDGATPMTVSIPRDLYLPSPCTGTYRRVNANLGGCKGFANGPTLLSLAVQAFAGIEVDHFALVNFDGFEAVIDALKGVTLCFEYPSRDERSRLDVEAGCQVADGATALAWVRSRRFEQLIDGEWVLAGGSDFQRQRRQQDLLFDLAAKLGSFGSLGAFANVASGLASSVRLDSGLSFGGAVSLAWSNRNLTKSSVERLSISVENYRTEAGAAVLIPTRSFNDILSAAYPPAAR